MQPPLTSAPRLGWCTNILPAETHEELLRDLHVLGAALRPTEAPIGGLMPIGLRLGERGVQALRRDHAALDTFRRGLAECGFEAFTWNAFPQGIFHDPVVKERVYFPDWTERSRLDYSLATAEVLAALLPDHRPHGSLSTVPLGFRAKAPEADFFERACTQLIAQAQGLADLEQRSGRLLRLAIEPEPTCILESTPQTLQFFTQELWPRADRMGPATAAAVRRHLGVCLDACHQAVLYEDVVASRDALVAAGIPIAKIQISCALAIDTPGRDPKDLERLAQFSEPRFLHQAAARTTTGQILRFDDLHPLLDELANPTTSLESARAHFHVPVHRAPEGRPGTTRNSLEALLRAESQSRTTADYEIETYTFSLTPGVATQADDPLQAIGANIAAELAYTRSVLAF